jgi:predicted 3-demethylubiquinone-9 3-methyltransferase (glyoxalase superfamily)
MKQKITPFLWFDGRAEEAARFYVSVFRNSKIVELRRSDKINSVVFELDGQQFIALDGGPQFKFTPAISLFVDCKSQAEVDELWERLSAGGEKSQCGWLKDKFSLSWQVIPSVLGDLLDDPNVVKAMLQMTKIDIAALQRAHASVGGR